MEGFFPPRADGGVAVGDGQDQLRSTGSPRSRDSLFLLARMTLTSIDDWREVRVRNLSAGGLMAEYDGAVAIGDPVRITLRGIGEVGGKVAWATEGRVGIALDREIDPKKARKPVATRTRR